MQSRRVYDIDANITTSLKDPSAHPEHCATQARNAKRVDNDNEEMSSQSLLIEESVPQNYPLWAAAQKPTAPYHEQLDPANVAADTSNDVSDPLAGLMNALGQLEGKVIESTAAHTREPPDPTLSHCLCFSGQLSSRPEPHPEST